MKTKHSELPWEVDGGSSVVCRLDNLIAISANGYLCGSRRVDAEFIVRCVNAHDKLVEACQAMEQSLLPYRGPDASEERTYTVSRTAVKELRTALALAEPQEATPC